MKRPITAVMLLARIDRKLSRILAAQQSGEKTHLSISQAAQIAGVSTNTIRRAIRIRDDHNRLHARNVAIGRKKPCWRIEKTDLDVWLKRRDGISPSPPRPTTRTSTGRSRHFKF